MPNEKMERLAAELVAMAEQMRGASTDAIGSDDDEEGPDEPPSKGMDPAERKVLLARWCPAATQIYRYRRRRDRVFGPLFGEPGWDVLLDLLIMEGKGRRVPVSSACIASGASHSTALRQIDELVRQGLIERERDEHDKRRTYLRLTDGGLRKMAVVLESSIERPDLRIVEKPAGSPLPVCKRG